MENREDITVIKYLDLDRDFCITVYSCVGWWPAKAKMEELRATHPHGNGIYFYGESCEAYDVDE